MRSLRVVRCCSSGFITLKTGVGVLHGRAALGLGGYDPGLDTDKISRTPKT